MAVKRFSRAGLLLLIAILLFWTWYWKAVDYSDNAIAGTYTYAGNGETSTLVLKKDQTFQQELNRGGTSEHAQGNWRRYGEGGIAFSKGFVPVATVKAESDGRMRGEVRKVFLELVPVIVLGPDRDNGPRFHRSFF
jgi:hypothetical protein